MIVDKAIVLQLCALHKLIIMCRETKEATKCQNVTFHFHLQVMYCAKRELRNFS